AHSIVLLGRDYRQKGSTRSLRTLKTKTDTVLRTLKKQGQTVLSRQRVMAMDTVKEEGASHTEAPRGSKPQRPPLSSHLRCPTGPRSPARGNNRIVYPITVGQLVDFASFIFAMSRPCRAHRLGLPRP